MVNKVLSSKHKDHAKVAQDQKNKNFQNACRIWFCPTDAKIANELRAMPQKEREKVWADLSGNEKTSLFKKEVVEDQEVIDKALGDMEGEIESTQEKVAYEMAMEQSAEYVQDRAFRLAFVRHCEYDGKKAGRLLIEHMATKRLLFGDSVLGRDIKLSDLTKKDMEILKSRGIQFLKERDASGRLILYSRMTSLKFDERENYSRAMFYLIMSAVKDETVQKLGVVLLWDFMSEYSGCYDYEADRMAIGTAGALPIRSVARYVLYESKLWDHVIDVLNQLISPYARARTRTIFGSREEVMDSLSCLGIPHHHLPTNQDGTMDLTMLNRWIRGRLKAESRQGKRRVESRRCDDKETPEEFDVPNDIKRRKLCV